jgi:8-oxo-dGTP diphosphatase
MKVENIPTLIPVVAIALIGPDGRICMQQRRLGGAYGGLWEFPGGKVEAGESPESALIREIDEELGVSLNSSALAPVAFASDPAEPPTPRAPHVILLYMSRRWTGDVQCLDGEAIGWFAPDELAGLKMPPLDYPLAERLVQLLSTGAI